MDPTNVVVIRRHPSTDPFPYTTLFRSWVPPPFNCSVPVCTSTVPVLLKGRLMVLVPVPADLRKVPALLKVRAEEHTSEPQSRDHIAWRLLLENVQTFM